MAGNDNVASAAYGKDVPTLAASSTAVATRVPRHKVFLPAEMVGTAGTTRIHLLNLSLTGALAYGEAPPEPGTVVQMRCGDAAWLARIVWAHDKRFGIVHLVPLTPNVVATLVGT